MTKVKTKQENEGPKKIVKEMIIDQFELCGCSGNTDFVEVEPLEDEITMKN